MTVYALFPREWCFLSLRLPAFLHGSWISLLMKRRHSCIIYIYRISWLSAVKVAAGYRIAFINWTLYGRTCGEHQGPQFPRYHSVAVARYLSVTFILFYTSLQLQNVGTLHHVALRVPSEIPIAVATMRISFRRWPLLSFVGYWLNPCPHRMCRPYAEGLSHASVFVRLCNIPEIKCDCRNQW